MRDGGFVRIDCMEIFEICYLTYYADKTFQKVYKEENMHNSHFVLPILWLLDSESKEAKSGKKAEKDASATGDGKSGKGKKSGKQEETKDKVH